MRLLIITYFISILTVGFAQHKDSLYNRGVAALSAKDFNTAEKCFSQNIEVAPSFESYYNLGYAYAKQKKWSESLWANEAALKYDPTNNKAIYNAKFALEKIAPDADWNHPYTWTERIILSAGETIWFILMAISSIVVAISLFFLISRKNSSKIIWSKRLIIPFAILFVLSALCLNKVLNHFEENKYAYAIDGETTLYLHPNGLAVDEDLPSLVRLNIVQDQKDWIQVLTPNSNSYWMKSKSLRVY